MSKKKREKKVKRLKIKKPKRELLRTPKGMHDILPADQIWWDRVHDSVIRAAGFYRFNRIETPILESASLFERGIGQGTDIIEKEMYILKTKGGDALVLRPEGTASVMRAYLQHSLGRLGQPQKLYYSGPMFRHENPQAGRYRQHHQLGFEIIGGQNDPLYDVQIILALKYLLEDLKLKPLVIKINSMGCRVCQPLYRRQLQNYYRRFEKDLCEDCRRRLQINPLRLLDCKNESCQQFKNEAPNILNKLCVVCTRHLKGVLEYLEELEINYSMNNQLTRGLTYYDRTVFEIFIDGLAGALAGGGRYDYLAEMIGGRIVPGVGGGIGVERIIEAMKIKAIEPPARKATPIVLIRIGEAAKKRALKTIEILRQKNIAVGEALGKESLKAQFALANKEKARLVLILGQQEVYENSVIIRDLKTGIQETVATNKMVEEIKKRLR